MEHAHLLEENGADSAILCQREAELVDVRAREVDARATADAPLQATRAAEDRATRAKRTAALARREVGFLKALNICSPLDYSLSLSSLGSWSISHEQTSYASRERRSLAGLQVI